MAALAAVRQFVLSHRLTYKCDSDGTHAAPSETLAITNATLLTDFAAQWAAQNPGNPLGYKATPLYKALKGTLFTPNNYADLTTLLATGIRMVIRPTLAPVLDPGASASATFVMQETAQFSLTANLPVVNLVGFPQLAAGATAYQFYVDILFPSSAAGQ